MRPAWRTCITAGFNVMLRLIVDDLLSVWDCRIYFEPWQHGLPRAILIWVLRWFPSVRTSQETHYVSATKPNRLMLFRETIAVYCENHTEHTNTLCGQNAEFSIWWSRRYIYLPLCFIWLIPYQWSVHLSLLTRGHSTSSCVSHCISSSLYCSRACPVHCNLIPAALTEIPVPVSHNLCQSPLQFLLLHIRLSALLVCRPTGIIHFTLNITVFNATLSTSVFYSSTTCFGHIGPSSGTIAIIATAVSL
jgi:hypothetical protein